MAIILEWEPGIGMGSDQIRAGRVAWAWVSWASPISRARRPWGAERLAATGRIDWNRSTARRVTSWKLADGSDSARAFCILMSVNVRARATSRRKAAFLWLDSIRVREISGAQSLRGMPGNPAPEPRSATVTSSIGGAACGGPSASLTAGDVEECRGKRWRAAKKDSPKWRVTISSSLRMAVRLTRAFQRSSRSIYVDI